MSVRAQQQRAARQLLHGRANEQQSSSTAQQHQSMSSSGVEQGSESEGCRVGAMRKAVLRGARGRGGTRETLLASLRLFRLEGSHKRKSRKMEPDLDLIACSLLCRRDTCVVRLIFTYPYNTSL